MRQPTIEQINIGLEELSKIFPAEDFNETNYSSIANKNTCIFYINNEIFINSLYKPSNIGEIVRPILKDYCDGNKNIELLNSYKHVLLHDCNPIQYAESLNSIKDIGVACKLGQISSSTVYNYRSLLRLLTTIKNAVIKGNITVPCAVDLARLGDTEQLDVIEKLSRNNINIKEDRVDYRLLTIFTYSKILNTQTRGEVLL